MAEPRYSVVEAFHSFQGEGVHMGRSAYFLRLYGCDQKCSFCDSAATWHPDWKPKEVRQMSVDSILAMIKAAVPDEELEYERTFVVITGGEPCLYDLRPLIQAIAVQLGRHVHIETAGHRALPLANWITMSPKFNAKAPLKENWERVDEIKLVCSSPQQMELDLTRIFVQLEEAGSPRPYIWLHPEWSQRENPELLAAIVKEIKYRPFVRAGYQLHKLFKADSFDPGALPEGVPLGGVIPIQQVTHSAPLEGQNS